MALTDKLSAIGNAIRAKTGGSAKLTLDEMPNAIASISGEGGGTVVNCNCKIYTGYCSNTRIAFDFDNNEDWKNGIIVFGVVEGNNTTIYRITKGGTCEALLSSTQPAYSYAAQNAFTRTGSTVNRPWTNESGGLNYLQVGSFISPATKFSPMVIPMILFQDEV